ncbi:vitamin K epoxide reductase family protein [Tenacibaculum sp. 190524A02b]|uniref:vitamin K epoxide reductase family protein n=1 Tax=Tenacibaculum vairaonense TaxID=3137860 RepID=UPI0031FADF79
MKDSLIILVIRLLKRNNISFNKEELSFQIQSHPSYPSIHAITGVLDHFNIENVAAEVPTDKETLLQLPDCFIAQINTDVGQELVTVERKALDYLILKTNNKEEKHTEGEFIAAFTGILLGVEEPEEDTVITKKVNNNLAYVVFGITAVLLGFSLFQSTSSILPVFHILLSVLGLVISVAIVKQELGLQTAIGNAFCSGTDDKKDCNAVLTSKGAELFKGYKLSDLSILFFTTMAISSFFLINSPELVYTISLLALPITLYSIYYQYKVVKKWCALCLSIVGVLWLQAGITFFADSYVSNFISNDWLIFGIVTAVVWLAWYYIKPLVSENKTLKKQHIENIRFKRNFAIFNSLLQKSPQVNTYIEKDESIIFGNPKATMEIVLVTNPFCGHCKPVHKQIHTLLELYGETVKVKVRFNVGLDDTESELVKITSSLLSIYKTQGEQVCLEAMDEIYGDTEVDTWLAKWENSAEKETSINELKKQQTWCTNYAINFTPEILINGRSYPKEYDRADLIFFIEDLEEESTQVQKPTTTIRYYDDTLLFN